MRALIVHCADDKTLSALYSHYGSDGLLASAPAVPMEILLLASKGKEQTDANQQCHSSLFIPMSLMIYFFLHDFWPHYSALSILAQLFSQIEYKLRSEWDQCFDALADLLASSWKFGGFEIDTRLLDLGIGIEKFLEIWLDFQRQTN